MSAECVVVFYGVRFDVADDEITALEERADHRLSAARRHGLKHYWGNFGVRAEEYKLFIGDKLGVLGLEGERSIHISADELSRRVRETEAKLREAGFAAAPALCMAWQPDT